MKNRYLQFILLTGCLLVSYIIVAQTSGMPFRYYQSLIYLDVKVNNRPNLHFLLNTGASTSVLHTRTADLLHLPVKGQDSVEGTAGKEAVKILRAASISCGGVTVRDMNITRRNLENWPSPDGKVPDGVLGMDFLSHCVVTIDYRNRKISVSPLQDKSAYTANLPFTLEDGIPRLQVSLNDTLHIPIRFNSGVSLSPSRDIFINISGNTWRQLKAYDIQLTPQQYLTGHGVGGNVYLPVARIRSMQIRDFLVNMPYVVVQPEEGYFKKEDAIGFFGNNFLEKYEKVRINFIRQQISFNMPKHKTANITVVKPKKRSVKIAGR